MNWYTAESADAEHEDIEVDLDALGNPGGASWASVSPDGPAGEWAWIVYDRWLFDDAQEIIGGMEPTKEAAKRAVERWVESVAET